MSLLRRLFSGISLRRPERKDLGLTETRSAQTRRVFHTRVENSKKDQRGMDAVMADFERAVLLEALLRFEGNQTIVSKKLQLPRTTLRSRLEKYGLVGPRSNL